jgi:hypothetical protein
MLEKLYQGSPAHASFYRFIAAPINRSHSSDCRETRVRKRFAA